MFFILEEVIETILVYSRGTVKVLWIYFALIQYQHKVTQCNRLIVKLSSSQLNKFKSGITIEH